MKVCMIVPNRMVKGGISSVTNGYRDSEYLNNKVKIKFVESYTDGNKIKKILKALIAYIQYLFLLIFFKPDIVHIHSSFGPSFYRKKIFIDIAYFFKVKIVNHIHGADFDEFYINASEKKKRKVKKNYNKCNVLIALSQEWKDKLSNIVNSNKIIIIHNYCVIKEGISRTENKNNTVLFLGEIGQRKGCFDIPYIAKKVKESIPTIKFVIAGKGKEYDELQFNKMLKELEISNCVSMPGWIRSNEKDKALLKADLFLLPSYNEGMPMSILDAMGYGLPIISTKVGGIPQIVIDNYNGYTFEPGDVDDMAKGIVQILQNEDIYKMMAKNSYELANNEYSLKRHVDHVISMYESLCKV